MKISTETKPQPFKPFTVSITFNSREEALRWNTMLSFNLSIPETVFGATVGQKDNREVLTQEMTLVQEAILKHL